MEPYSQCPCGSGKQFKFCCQPFYHHVEKSMKLLEEGQLDAALRNIDKLVQEKGNLPQTHGYKAQILFLLQRYEEADESLQKAFDLNPHFAFGLYLRGVIRLNEGETVGALLQFRKATELYDPKATELLSDLHFKIANAELQFNRPIAARASLEKAVKCTPTDEELRNLFDSIFGEGSRFPRVARQAYSFRSAPAGREEAWNQAINQANNGRLTEAATAFESLTTSDPTDASAWFNLGLVRAWLGNNPRAVEAFSQSLANETSIERNTETGALIEVLRLGYGMKDDSDYLEHAYLFRITDPNQLVALLQEYESKRRLVAVRADQQSGTLSGFFLEDRMNLGMGIGNPVAPCAASMMIVGQVLRLSNTNREQLDRFVTELRLKLTTAIMDAGEESNVCSIGQATFDAMCFPHRAAEPAEIAEKMGEHAQQYFEEKWLHKNLRSLAGLTPLDAMESNTYRKRLPGLVLFLEEAFYANAPRDTTPESQRFQKIYDFNRLRQKLGILQGGAMEDGKSLDFSVMPLSQLATLDRNHLSDQQLEDAFRAAQRLDAPELASAFGQLLIDRPMVGAKDRYPIFNHLIEQARSEGKHEAALSLLDRAEQADSTGNEGKRRNDLTLRRAQLLGKLGRIDDAVGVFERLCQDNPNEAKYYGSAAEAMLGMNQRDKALSFAEQGLAKARSQNNRDLEGYFQELMSAAKK